MKNRVTILTICSILLSISLLNAQTDPLPSWNDSKAKQNILKFVSEVTKKGGANFVAPEDRIATFDNDGTLWAENPIYFQLLFAMDRVKALAPKHPEWKTQQPFQAVLANDMKGVAASGEKGLGQIMMVTHAGITTDEFASVVKSWIETAKHPKFQMRYDQMIYQPMLELLSYLRRNGFKTYIVSGGGIEFMRTFSQRVYGIPPEQVIGSSIKTKFEMRDGTPVLMRLPEINFVDDKDGKPLGINQFIGRRPIAAFGNSDGDLQMLQWTTAGNGLRFALIVHHTDAAREYSYDRQSSVGKLDKAWDEAQTKGWTVVDMKKDWKVIFPFQKK
ncbi:MAG TPA: HAD family hydrolase [Acidobacteriota bacterium]|nr:HAD family hydrolase [Acidobacteriota bacterium]